MTDKAKRKVTYRSFSDWGKAWYASASLFDYIWHVWKR